MILIGMFDSPYVRRVAISLDLLGFTFEHRNWSVGADFARIREYNPVGRVPTLVLDDGEVLVESSAILDWIDDRVGPERALLPATGGDRQRALKLMGIATSGVDKGVAQLYEVAFRPLEKRHAPWVDRCRAQSDACLDALDSACAALAGEAWLLGARMSQADVTVACVSTFLHEALQLDATRRPALARHVARLESLPVFGRYHQPFFAPSG